MTERINRFLVRAWLGVRREEGQALTEYALVLALIVVAATVTALTGIGSTVTGKLQGVFAAIGGS